METKIKAKKGKGCLIALIVLFVFGIIVAIIISSGGSDLTNGKVTYVVEGTTTKASVTYSTNMGSQEQLGEVDLPFKKDVEVKYGIPLVILAQNKNDAGSITCRILVNGKEIQSSTSEGAYVIATCSGLNMPKP
jgi:hypothetical protein